MPHPRSKRAEALNLAATGVPLRAAAERAGFSDPADDANRLVHDPKWRDALLNRLQVPAAKWTIAIATSIGTLLEIQTATDNGRWRYGAEARGHAAGKLLTIALRLGVGKSLMERAEAEDQAATPKEAARKVLGGPAYDAIATRSPNEPSVQ